MSTPRRGPRRALLLFTQTYAAGGIQRCNQTFVRALGQLGTACEVLSLMDPVGTVDPHPAAGLRVRGFAGRRLRFALAVLWEMIGCRHDVVLVGHINFAVFAAIARRLSPVCRPRLLMLAHGIEVWSGLGRRHGWALSNFDRVVCVSAYTRDRIRAQFPALGPERFTIHHNALHPDWVHAQAAVAPGAPPPGHEWPQRYLLSVSRLDASERYKGIATALEVFAMLDDPALHYVIAGGGNDVGFLQGVARRLGVEPRVRFANRVSDADLAALYRGCQAFVLPSGKEGFGIVYLEAMFFGAPVIAARAGGTVDAVDDGRTGLLAAFGNSVELHRQVLRVLHEPDTRERLRAQALEGVTGNGHFTFASFTARLGRLLDDVEQARDRSGTGG